MSSILFPCVKTREELRGYCNNRCKLKPAKKDGYSRNPSITKPGKRLVTVDLEYLKVLESFGRLGKREIAYGTGAKTNHQTQPSKRPPLFISFCTFLKYTSYSYSYKIL